MGGSWEHWSSAEIFVTKAKENNIASGQVCLVLMLDILSFLGCMAMEKLIVKVERRRVLLYKCIIEVASSRTQLPDKWLMQHCTLLAAAGENN